jgi:ABC-type antimicrobial peptide transport system permease subunit
MMSYVVARRTRELGIRVALGGTPARTMWMVLGQGMSLIGIGAAVGLAVALGVTRLLRGLLYGVSPLDAATWLAVTMGLAAVAAVAMLLPARRAALVDPVVAIRDE